MNTYIMLKIERHTFPRHLQMCKCKSILIYLEESSSIIPEDTKLCDGMCDILCILCVNDSKNQFNLTTSKTTLQISIHHKFIHV